MSESDVSETERAASPGDSQAETPESASGGLAAGLAELRDRVAALELEHLQLRTKYVQTQALLLRYERGSDPEWSEAEDADVQVLNDQADMLKHRILTHGDDS